MFALNVSAAIAAVLILCVPAAQAQTPPVKPAPVTRDSGGQVLYSPNLAANPDEAAGYPRLIRLAHAGAGNGTILATFAHSGVQGEKGSQPVFRSTDNGATWSKTPIGVVRDTVHGWDMEAPALFELPVAQGDLPAGTLFAAGTAWNRPDFRQQAMEIFISRDGGANWTYRSSCVSESLQVNNEGHGIWEPFFAMTRDGSLNCFFSDERPSADGFAQVIAHVRSTDGGATWGPEIVDIAVHDGTARPGMPSVVRLPDGRYAMSFENCQANHDPDQVCTVYMKTSPDGQDWTPVAGLGAPIATADGRRLLHTPYLAWTPAGGPDGTLIATGQRVVTGPDDHVHVEPESGTVVMVNHTLGRGPWSQAPAPVVVAPTGGYDKGEVPCAGYSSPLLASDDGHVLMLAGKALPNGKCEVRYGSAEVAKTK